MNKAAYARAMLVAAFLCLLCAGISAQSAASPGGDPDSLFTDGAASAPLPSAGEPAPEMPAADNRIHFFGSLNIYGLSGLGWAQQPVLAQLGDSFGAEAGGSLTANLGFEVRPASELRVRGTLSYYFPNQGPLFSEMIVDYSVLNSVFFRIGTFSYTWGNSQFFQFANLPSRSLPGWSTSNVPAWEKTNLITSAITSTLPVSVKMNIPFGLNGITFLARFDMANYGFPDQFTPRPQDAGYGLQYDMVTGPIEWSVAGFWQHLLTPRSLLAMKTSIWGFDLSGEMTLASPVVNGQFQGAYATAVIGLSREWTDAHVKLYAEYAYNGERDSGISLLTDAIGPGGHNSAAVVRFSNLGPSGLAFNLLWQQNWSDGSGLVAPFLEISPVSLTTIQIGLPVVFGPESGEVPSNRLVPGAKRVELLILVKLSASFRQ